MSPIVQTVTRWINSFIFIFGLYVMLYGHVTPGGGFPGGVIIACSFILITLAAGKEFTFRLFSLKQASVVDSLSILLFLIIGFLGMVFGNYFFANFLPPGEAFRLQSGGTIVFSNVVIGFKVSAAIFAMFLYLSLFRLEEGAGEE